MQLRGLLIAVVSLGLLAAGVYWSERTKEAEEGKESPSKLVQLKDEDIRKLEIRRRDTSPVVLERGKENKWQMTAPQPWRVDEEAVNSLASAYTSLSYDRVIDEAGADAAGYGLATPAVEVLVTGKDNKTRKLQIGEETPTGAGAYARFAGEPRIFTVPTATKGSFDKSAKDLRDKRLLVFDAEKLNRVDLSAKGTTIEFGRNAQNEWQIVKPASLRADNGQVEELVRKLADARMDTSVPDEEAAKLASSFSFGTRVATAGVSGPSGTQTLEVRKRGEDYLARSSAVEGVFRVASDVGESLNKGLEDFRNKKLFDFGFNEPSAVTIRDGDKSYAFTKSGENWTSAGNKQMDATSVQNLIDKLRDLTAIRYMNSGFTTPTIEISVTSDAGKRVEKVQIARSGAMYLARRENEPAIYEIDGKAIQELQQAAADVKAPPPPPKK